MINIVIDNKVVNVLPNITVMQACLEQKIDVPRFCYHERLSIAGSCRMCLVEVSNSKKLVASCAFPVVEGLKVFTNSLRVKKAREGVLEFLLANHPLDCPICDQGGECDLQDITMVFGSDRGRFYEVEKRAVEDKDCGPFIKTVMTRCIHCTRCVRFLSELGGDGLFGTTGRGLAMQIGTYIPQNLDDELSGNIIDLCPVGALTSKPFAFTSRTWELTSVESLDISDTLGTRIRMDIFFNKVMRILPRQSLTNEEWITNLTRFSYESLTSQRLVSPMVRKSVILKHRLDIQIQEVSDLINTSWDFILDYLSEIFLSSNKIFVNYGSFLDVESVIASQDTFSRLGLSSFGIESLSLQNIDFSSNYLLNSNINSLEYKVSDFVLFGFVPRIENPLLNLRFRKSYLNYNTKYYSVGSVIYSSFPISTLGCKVSTLFNILEGRHQFVRSLFNDRVLPFILLGNTLISNLNIDNYLNILRNYFSKFSTYLSTNHKNLLNNMGFIPHKDLFFGLAVQNFTALTCYDLGVKLTMPVGGYDFVYALNTSELIYDKSSFVCYQGSHGDKVVDIANIVLPALFVYETDASFINIEGIYYSAKKVISGSKSVLSHVEVFQQFYKKICKVFSNWNFYKENINLYSHVSFKVSERLKFFTVKRNELSQYSLALISRSYYTFNNVFINPYFYTYYNQNTLSRVSRVLSIAAKNEIKKLKIIRS